MYSVKNRVFLITGAGSGIGRATALLAAQFGARVIVADIDANAGAETVRMVLGGGGDAEFIEVDISSDLSVKRMVDYSIQIYGRLDAAFNNAGIPPVGQSMMDIDPADFRRCFEVNLWGCFLCMRHEIPVLLSGGGGAILNTSSGAGAVGIPLAPEYTAMKHGVVGLTKSAAVDFSSRGIRVNCLLPGGTRTPLFDRAMASQPDLERHVAQQQPIGRMASPEEQAAAALWLLSPAASFVTGAAIPVDGGYLAV